MPDSEKPKTKIGTTSKPAAKKETPRGPPKNSRANLPGFYFEKRPKKSELTLRHIERESQRQSHEKVDDVTLWKIEKGLRASGNPVVRCYSKTDGPTYRTWVECTSRDKNGNPHKINVGKVKCSCTCPYFVFWGCEVPLNKRGAANIKYSNGAPPVIRNPTSKRRFCKHGLALMRLIRQRGY